MARRLCQTVTWARLWGVSCLAGFGFTMSIFVDELAFNDPAIIDEAKVGILAASLIAGVLGYIGLETGLVDSLKRIYTLAKRIARIEVPKAVLKGEAA